jgi:hypothetical protein
MQLSDDGNLLVVESSPWLIGKIFAVVFGILAVLMPLILVLSLVLPPNLASIDCDRARGSCLVARSAWKDELTIAQIERAKLVYVRGARNASGSHHLVLLLKDGHEVRLSESIYRKKVRDPAAAAAAGLNRFLADDAAPGFQAGFVSSDTDYAVLIPYAILSPLFFWLFLTMWVSRTLVVDRAARTVRLRQRRKLHQPTDETFAFEEVSGVGVFGYNWAQLSLKTARGSRILLLFPYSAEMRLQLIGLTDKLTASLGVPLIVDDDRTRQRWQLADQRDSHSRSA